MILTGWTTVSGAAWDAAWEAGSRWLLLLKPLEVLYRMGVCIRYELYQWGWLPIQRHPLPVVVVGNLRVGGTGKTPLVIALADCLQRQGYRVGVVSRGFGGRAPVYPLRVADDSDPVHCGDEALLIRRRSGVPVVVDPDRNRAVAELAADCDLVISDDGLQHYAMGRDLEVVLVGDSGHTNDRACLPVGPLREPPARLARADWVLTSASEESPMPREGDTPVVRIEPLAWVNLATGERCPPSDFAPGSSIRALAGIARPMRFFQLLQDMGLVFEQSVFADHHVFSPAELLIMSEDCLLMTEKDAVKCQGFAQPHMWYLEIRARLPAAFEAGFLKRIKVLKTL